MLVVVEGLDGSGKSTQVKKLKGYLQSRCGGVEYIHFPRYDSPVYGDLIGKFLKGAFGAVDEVHPQLVALLYAEDRHAALPELKSKLDSGVPVLLDRYVYSNIAYQCAKTKTFEEESQLRDWIFNTEFGDFGLPRPDLNIFLDVPVSFVEQSLHSARQGSDRDYLQGGQDIHEADMNFQKAVRRVYLNQCEIDDTFIRVDCADSEGRMASPEVIFGRIKEVVDKVLA